MSPIGQEKCKVRHRQVIYRVSKHNWKRLIDHRTKGFCSIINSASDFDRKHYYLDFETKFAQIH